MSGLVKFISQKNCATKIGMKGIFMSIFSKTRDTTWRILVRKRCMWWTVPGHGLTDPNFAVHQQHDLADAFV